MVPNFKQKGNIRSRRCHRAVKLFENEIKGVEKRFCIIVIVNEMKFNFMPDAAFILRTLQEDYHAKGKKLNLFCGPRKSF